MQEPKLDPPGAGLPALELFIARRIYFPISFHLGGVKGGLKKFESETKKIRDLISGIGNENRNQRVLINRLTGLEDSSRFWSVNMVLEHLTITMSGMSGLVDLLSQEIPPNREIKTENVKPTLTATDSTDIQNKFEKTFETALQMARDKAQSKSRVTWKHPWFGELSVQGWIWLMGDHQAIHRRQIACIKAQRKA